ncbi:MAG: pilus assembly protein, partial [Acidimicrobiales bacterium]|nr:pilus assembly protein [Acidimicrobiales bacterium]
MSNHNRRERAGAALETAILVPLLLLMALGGAEMGFAWHAASRLESAVASGARVAAQAGDDPQADWEVLQAMRGALGPDIS